MDSSVAVENRVKPVFHAVGEEEVLDAALERLWTREIIDVLEVGLTEPLNPQPSTE